MSELRQYTKSIPHVVGGGPTVYTLHLQVGPQEFQVCPHSCPTRGEAEWAREILEAALERIVSERRNAPTSAPPLQRSSAPPTKRRPSWW